MAEWNAVNTVIHYFYKEGRKFEFFSVWVGAGHVVKTHARQAKYLGQNIGVLVADLTRDGWKHEVIN